MAEKRLGNAAIAKKRGTVPSFLRRAGMIHYKNPFGLDSWGESHPDLLGESSLSFAGGMGSIIHVLEANGASFQYGVSEEELRGQGLSDGQIYNLHKFAEQKGIDLSSIPGPQRYRSGYTGSPNPRKLFEFYKNAIKNRAKKK